MVAEDNVVETVGAPWLAAVMAADIDYLTHLRTESQRFAEVMRTAPAEALVPTCPDWTSDDLLWHLGEVQWFWASIVRDKVTDPTTLEYPDRPTDRSGLLDFFESVSSALQQTLAETAPEEVRWTWSKEQTAGFSRRRQAHEALIHRVDAELTADVARTPMDPDLSTDGIDEALRIMFGSVPDWGSVDPEPGATLRIDATDSGRSWLVTLGRFTGTNPEGKTYDEPDIVVTDADSPEESAAAISGAAADLDCWLWGRPTSSSLERSGAEGVLARFQAILDQGLD